jgi:hypothetical protein
MKYFRSPTQAGLTDTKYEYYTMFQRQLTSLLQNPVKRISASIWIKTQKAKKPGLLLYFVFDNWNHTIHYYKDFHADDFAVEQGKWTKIQGIVDIPEWVDQTDVINVGIRDINKSGMICFDDLKLCFE